MDKKTTQNFIDIILKTLSLGFVVFVVLEFVKPGFVSSYINLTYWFGIMIVVWIYSLIIKK